MVTVKRGTLVATLTGKLTLTVAAGKATGTTTFTGDGASQVVTGQTVTLVFMGQAGSAGQGSAPSSARPSVAPSAQGAGQASPPSGGMPGSARGGLSGKTAKGTVSSVQHSSDGSATAEIAIAKLPTGVTAKSVGMATINAGVLARNVLIISTAAIKGSGGNATVQVIAGGQTTTRKVVVGKQTQTESEIVSGLSVGDNVVYERTMRGGFPGAGGGQPQGQGAPGQSGSQANGVGGGT
jgi:macrolide-specific efflux system membrane fusion protein